MRHSTLADTLTSAIQMAIASKRKWKGAVVPRIRTDSVLCGAIQDHRLLKLVAAIARHVAFRIEYPKRTLGDRGISMTRNRRFRRKLVLTVEDTRQHGHREIYLSHADRQDIGGAVFHEMQAYGLLTLGAIRRATDDTLRAFWRDAMRRARSEIRMDKTERRNPTRAEAWQRATAEGITPPAFVESAPAPYETRHSPLRRDLAQNAWHKRQALKAAGKLHTYRKLLLASIRATCGFGHGLSVKRKDGKVSRTLQPRIGKMLSAMTAGCVILAENPPAFDLLARLKEQRLARAEMLATFDNA